MGPIPDHIVVKLYSYRDSEVSKIYMHIPNSRHLSHVINSRHTVDERVGVINSGRMGGKQLTCTGVINSGQKGC